ncbi:undecaprenyl-phosphate galactose phosphotransferase [Fictibacillus macauensis ZFHKF-1]|uniref:Undecaprenyl-phosphate galactose phosphotransferase n=1 Tax=Fictibacillus macauensis ZFHKF-1 TaxID=1196324 RepID=I8J443_9BACL|nr:sugar transferase [Fictibacillus macauensis]EIT86536.1 undecaprenyl-phosphate galactose phosphotransferase [Fictibacillus macauensis ZFHKF-1]
MKRMFDFIIALCFITLFSGVFLLMTILIRTKLGTPVLFKQERPGLAGKPFYIYKFRTMTDQRDANGQLLADHERLTKFGQWVRKWSLDELPQLFNILKGELSLVGPRPLLMDYLPLYNEEQAKRHLVKPGITGWAQVNGRNAITWEEKFAYDVWYVRHQSLRLDLKILWLTARKIMKPEGISHANHVTMEPFKGNEPLTKDRSLL